MTRSLLCRKCGEPSRTKPIHPEDRAQGYKMRIFYISIGRTPDDHGVSINGRFSRLEHVVCDMCSEPLNGTIAIARTMWRGDSPHCWEQDFGTILTSDVVAAGDKLAGNEPMKGHP